MHYPNFVLYVEVDEHRHAFYDSTCEAVRLDVVQYGSQVNKPSLMVRFNPHVMKGESEVPFEVRIKNLAQYLRNAALTFPELFVAEDSGPVMYIQYMFYGTESAQKRVLENYASNTIIFLKDIDFSDDLLFLEEDIATFSMNDICEKVVDKEATSAALERMRSHSSKTQCSALSNYKGKKQHRCSSVSSATSDLCCRHNKRVKDGYPVHRVTE